jgi:hypothetical protein
MIYTLNIIIFSFLLGLIICLLICANRIDKLKERVETLESDLDKLENICTSFITENDLDDFCESLYINIQGVGDKIKRGIQDEIDSK